MAGLWELNHNRKMAINWDVNLGTIGGFLATVAAGIWRLHVRDKVQSVMHAENRKDLTFIKDTMSEVKETQKEMGTDLKDARERLCTLEGVVTKNGYGSV